MHFVRRRPKTIESVGVTVPVMARLVRAANTSTPPQQMAPRAMTVLATLLREATGLGRRLGKAAGIAAMALAVVVALPTSARPQTTSSQNPPHSAWKSTHRVVIQVTQNDPAVMNMALNNAENLVKFYKDKGEAVQVELVAYGAGLNMVRDDTSPVKDRLAAIAGITKNVTFSGCGNTLTAQSKQENKEIRLVPEARIVPAGIARIVELEEQGWTYVRP